MNDELSNILASLPSYQPGTTNYEQLCNVIDEIGRDIRAGYTYNKVSTERLKRNIINARVLIRGCLVDAETDKKSAEAAIEAQRIQDEKERLQQKKEKEASSTPKP